MRFKIFPIAFCAITNAAPISPSHETTAAISRRNEGFRQFEEGHYRRTPEEPEYNNLMYNGPMKFEVLNEDPTYAQIFQHIENILDSLAPPQQQLEQVLDAIVHHKESPQTHSSSLSPDGVVAQIFQILSSKESSEEKIDAIYEEITKYSDGNEALGLAVDDQDAVVLQRIRLILYGEENGQQKVKKLLDELANYFELDQGV